MTIEGEPWILGGDILVAINGQDVQTSDQYAKVLHNLKAKQSIELTVVRNGEFQTKSVTLGERPMPARSPARPKSEPPSVVPQRLEFFPF